MITRDGKPRKKQSDRRKEISQCSKCHILPKPNTKLEDLPFNKVKRLYNSRHCSYWLSECKHCKQPYLVKLNEIIGCTENDSKKIYSYWLPLNYEELSIINQTASTTMLLESYCSNRQCLALRQNNEYTWHNV